MVLPLTVEQGSLGMGVPLGAEALYQQMLFWGAPCSVGQTLQNGLGGDGVRHSFGHTSAIQAPASTLTSVSRRTCWLSFKTLGFCQCQLALTGVLGTRDEQ